MFTSMSSRSLPAFTSEELAQFQKTDSLKGKTHNYSATDQHHSVSDDSELETEDEDWQQIGTAGFRMRRQETPVDPALLALYKADSYIEVDHTVDGLDRDTFIGSLMPKENISNPKMPKQPPGLTKKQRDANRYVWNKEHRTPEDRKAISKKRRKAWSERTDKQKEATYFSQLNGRRRESDETRAHNDEVSEKARVARVARKKTAKGEAYPLVSAMIEAYTPKPSRLKSTFQPSTTTPITLSETTVPETCESAVSILVLARHSWKRTAQEILDTESGNEIVLTKFISDFIEPTPVLATELLVWKFRPASTPLPWVLEHDNDNLYFPAGNFENEDTDDRFCRFFETRPTPSKVVIVIRGIDGGSTDLGSWLSLSYRFSGLDITLAFTASQHFVSNRVPANANFFFRTAPYDHRLYSFLRLSVLIDHVSNVTPDERCAWLISEWRLAKLCRVALSMAYQIGDKDEISITSTQFHSLCTKGRHGLPFI